MATNDGLVIPVTLPGGDAAAQTLGRIADAAGHVGEAGASSSAQLEKIGDAASRSEQHLADLKVTGNAALQELGQKGAEFAASIGGAGGAAAELGVKLLGTAGPYGAMAAAAVGAFGMIATAINEHMAAVQLDADKAREAADATSVLGASYPALTRAINAATTAAEAHKIAVQGEIAMISARIALMAAGQSPEEAQREVDVVNAMAAAREHVTAAMIESALSTGNSAVQQEVLGFAFRHSSDAIEESINRHDAISVIAARNAREAADHARAENQQAVDRRRAAQEEVTLAIARQGQGLDRAQTALAEATSAANQAFVTMNATEATANGLHDEGAAAAIRLANATRDAAGGTGSLSDAEKDLANQRQAGAELEARKHAAAAGAAGETAFARRAGEEALRVAEQTYSQGERALTLFEQQSRATQALSFAEQELARARAASALGGQTPTERDALIASLNAEATARRGVAEATLAQDNRLKELMERATGRAAGTEAEIAAENAREYRAFDFERRSANSAGNYAKAQESANNSLIQQRASYGGRMKSLLGEEKTANGELANATVMGFRAVGSALSKHAQAFADGKEDVADAAQGMLKDVLSSIGSEAMIKGAMMMAEGAAALAGIYTAPLAAGNFAAGAAFFAVGALASSAGGLIPNAASAGGAGGGGGAAPAPAAGGMGPSGSSGPSGGPTITTVNYYAPTFGGGREGTNSEVGQRIDRYRNDSTALRRTP